MEGAGGLGKHVHAVIGCPGLLEDLPVSAGCFYVLFNPQVGGLVLPSDVDEFNLHLAGYEPDAQVTVEELAAKARIVIGRDADVEVRRSSPYLIHELTAADLPQRQGADRGDACHLFCPFGGFNMNTGIDDAANLGWKLAAVLAGWGADGLLDSYEAERRPIALANSPGRIRQRRRARQRDRLGDRRRRARRRERRGGRGAPPPWQRALRRDLPRMEHRRDRARPALRAPRPVIVDDGSDAPPWDRTRYVPLAKPGHRAPHGWLDGVPLYDRLGAGMTLLDFGAPAATWTRCATRAAARGVPLHVLEPRDRRPRRALRAAARDRAPRPARRLARRARAAPTRSR